LLAAIAADFSPLLSPFAYARPAAYFADHRYFLLYIHATAECAVRGTEKRDAHLMPLIRGGLLILKHARRADVPVLRARHCRPRCWRREQRHDATRLLKPDDTCAARVNIIHARETPAAQVSV
jgi:hypothetical protein